MQYMCSDIFVEYYYSDLWHYRYNATTDIKCQFSIAYVIVSYVLKSFKLLLVRDYDFCPKETKKLETNPTVRLVLTEGY